MSETKKDLEIIELVFCLRAVATGIWHDKAKNACGLAGGSVVVHEIERVLKKHKDVGEIK